MRKSKLSADPASLILGIVGLVIIVPGCCCGLFDIVALAICIIGLVMANKSLREYNMYRDTFDPQSRGNVNTGKILCIIGIIISGLIMLAYAVYFAFWGVMLSDAFKDRYYNRGRYNNQYQVQDSTENYQDFGYHDSIPKDTIVMDTTTVHVEPVK